MIADALLELLVCPKSKGPLIYFPRGEKNQDLADGFLLAPGARLKYRITDGVPVMLVDEAEEVPADAVKKLVALARELQLRIPPGL
ncbi:MAG TPA: Trm112 family protein [Kofleriaceae bacterium]|nr:Trm112 family protein [Kofleriaceae bacterium]